MDLSLQYGQQLLSNLVSEDGRIQRIAEALGKDADVYLVGGTVRDALLGIPPKDLDLAVATAPSEVLQALVKAGIHCIPTGLKHQTVTAVPDGFGNVEITTFRGPGMTPAGGAVIGSSIEEDLKYRDFTINALAFSVRDKKIVDVSNGLSDLTNKILRAVGNAKARFSEDPLRAIRLVRFQAQLGYSMEAGTREAAKEARNALESVSVERLREEFSKILISVRPAEGLMNLLELGFLDLYSPELVTCVDFEQNRFHRADVFRHTLEVVQNTEPDLVLRLAALFHDIGKPPTLSVEGEDRHFFLHEKVGAEMTEEILTRLKYPNSIVDQVVTLVRTHMRPLDAGPPGLRRLLRDTGELYPAWRKLKESDALACRVDPDEYRTRLEVFDKAIAEVQAGPKLSPLSSLAIDGNDLIEMGMKPGRPMGDLLRALHEKVLDDPALNVRETLLDLASEMSGLKGTR